LSPHGEKVSKPQPQPLQRHGLTGISAVRAAGFRREEPSRRRLMPLREGEHLSDRTERQSGEILVNLLDGGTQLEIGHDGVWLYPRALNDGPTAYLSGNTLHEIAIVPIHVYPCPSLSLLNLYFRALARLQFKVAGVVLKAHEGHVYNRNIF
jgi:hypothetical protein